MVKVPDHHLKEVHPPTSNDSPDMFALTEDLRTEESTEEGHSSDDEVDEPSQDAQQLDDATQLDEDVIQLDPTQQDVLPSTGKGSRLVFTEEQEQKIVEWYRSHPLFYDKSHKEYKHKNKRDKMMNAFAESINIPGEL